MKTYLHHEIKFDTLSRAKKVPLFAAGKKCMLPIARMGPARPDVIDFVIDLLRACLLAKYSSAAIRTLFACCKLNRNPKMRTNELVLWVRSNATVKV